MKNLERYSAVVFGILCQVDGRHASSTELAIDRVEPAEGILQSLDWKDSGNGSAAEERGVNMISPRSPVKLRGSSHTVVLCRK